MCGIAGIVQITSSEKLFEKIKSMTDALAHRGPDGEGHWIDSNNSIALGHRRLSIIDLSIAANQPMHWKERYHMVYNGEIYNYIELRENLIQKGYQFSTNSDSEILLALFDDKKEACLQDLDGMFAFAIWDEIEQILFCARDRFGEKPFYFTENNAQFLFASEMKAFWHVGISKTPNKQRIFDYLAYNKLDSTTDSKSTFYNDIFQIEAAHYFYYKPGDKIEQKKYWQLDLSKTNTTITFEEAQQTFFHLFKESIERRLRSDVPVGSSLSGGLDSSSIVMLIDQIKHNQQLQHTFSARFEGFIRDEGPYIDTVVKHTKTKAHAINCTTDLLTNALDKIAYHQEEPFGSTSIAAQWHVMQLAKENNITVLLDGQGADEYLAGYSSYYINYFASLRLKNKALYKKNKSNYVLFYGKHFHTSRLFYLDCRFPKLRDRIRRIRNKTIRKPAYLQQFEQKFLDQISTESYNSDFLPNLNEELKRSIIKTSLPILLRYADRNSMAHGREVRLPFLSHKLVEFVFSLPDEYKIRDIWTKAVLRFSMKDILPSEICWRKEKVGFEPPLNKTISQEKFHHATRVLIEKGILNPNKILKEKAWEYLQISNLFLE